MLALLSTIQKRIGKVLADSTARCARPRGKECFSISVATGALVFACSTGALDFVFSTGVHLSLRYPLGRTCLCVLHHSMSWNRRSTSSMPKSTFTSGAVAWNGGRAVLRRSGNEAGGEGKDVLLVL